MMRNTWLLFVPMLLLLPTSAAAPAWYGIIDPSRAIDWSNTGVGATIVNRTTQCGPTVAAYNGTADTVNSALASCNNGYVLLGPGTFTLSTGINFGGNSNVTLRGSGPTQTIINFTGGNICGGNGGDICAANSTLYFVGSPAVQYGTGSNTANWTAGFAQGTTQITLSTTNGLSVGMTLFLDQQDDGAKDTGGVDVCQVPPCATELPGGQGRSGRAQLEIKQITALNGNVVAISPGLYNTNWRAAQNPGAWWVGSMLTGVGIENLTVNHANSTSAKAGVYFFSCHSCWLENIRSLDANRNHVWCYQSSNVTIRDSYFYGTQNSTTLSYGFEGYGCADALVENNIFQHITSPVVIDNTTGLVEAYNFTIDEYIAGAAAWLTAGHEEHAAGTAFNLFEGNQTAQFEADVVHGTHNQETLFRNWITGLGPGKREETVPIILYAFSRGFNIIGNVLGTPGYHTNYEDRYDLGTTASGDKTIYVLGFCNNPDTLSTSTCVNAYQGNQTVYNDALTPATVFRWGNYDAVTGAVRWESSEVPTTRVPYVNGNPVPASHALPASLYLPSRPAWWGLMPWPAIGPDVTGGAGPGGFAYPIPAAVCYNATPRDSSGILLFDANACYKPLRRLPPIFLKRIPDRDRPIREAMDLRLTKPHGSSPS